MNVPGRFCLLHRKLFPQKWLLMFCQVLFKTLNYHCYQECILEWCGHHLSLFLHLVLFILFSPFSCVCCHFSKFHSHLPSRMLHLFFFLYMSFKVNCIVISFSVARDTWYFAIDCYAGACSQNQGIFVCFLFSRIQSKILKFFTLSSCHIFFFLLSRINSQIMKLIPTCSVQCCSGRSFWVWYGEGFFLIYPQGCLTITISHFISPQKKPHNYFPFFSNHTSTVCLFKLVSNFTSVWPCLSGFFL